MSTKFPSLNFAGNICGLKEIFRTDSINPLRHPEGLPPPMLRDAKSRTTTSSGDFRWLAGVGDEVFRW